MKKLEKMFDTAADLLKDSGAVTGEQLHAIVPLPEHIRKNVEEIRTIGDFVAIKVDNQVDGHHDYGQILTLVRWLSGIKHYVLVGGCSCEWCKGHVYGGTTAMADFTYGNTESVGKRYLPRKRDGNSVVHLDPGGVDDSYWNEVCAQPDIMAVHRLKSEKDLAEQISLQDWKDD